MAATRLHSDTSAPLLARLQTMLLACFHFLFLATPFFFTWVNEELFEFNKMILTYAVTGVILGLWISKMWLSRQWHLKRTPLDWPIALFVLSQVLSTLFSIDPHTSFYGYYTRFHGGLLSTLTYVALFYAFVSNVPKKELPRFILTLVLAGFGSALYAIPEHFGASPSCLLIAGNFNASCWVQDVQNRVFGTFGQPNWLAAYAILLWPLALVTTVTETVKLASAKKWVRSSRFWLSAVTTIALYAVLLFTKSRSGWLGLMVSLITLSSAAVVIQVPAVTSSLRALWDKVPFHGMAKAGKNHTVSSLTSSLEMKRGILVVGLILGCGGLVSLVFGTPYSPSLSEVMQRSVARESVSEVTQESAPPPANRLDVGGTDSGEIRKIVWQGAIDVFKRYPIFGSGVETFAYSYYQDRPAAHNLVSEWDFLYNKAHNEFLNFLATSGRVGLVTYCLLLAATVLLSFSALISLQRTLSEKWLIAALISGIAALSVSNFFGFSTVAVTTLLFIFMAMVVLIGETTQTFSPPKLIPKQLRKLFTFQPKVTWALIVLATLWSVWTVLNWWLADLDFAQGKRHIESGQTAAGLHRLQTASRRMPQEAVFLDELSVTYAQLAVAYHQSQDLEVVPELVQAAELASDKTILLNSRHLNFLKNRARVFILLSEIEPSALLKAEKTLLYAQTLAPTDAKLLYNLALVQAALEKNTDAIATLEKTVALKPNYEAAYLELGNQWEMKQDWSKAQQQYQWVLDQLSADNPTALARVEALAASVSAQTKP